MLRAARTAAVSMTLVAALVGVDGCAAASCPAVLVLPRVRLDASALLASSTLDKQQPLQVRLCVGARCATLVTDPSGRVTWGADLQSGRPETVTASVTNPAGKTFRGSITSQVADAAPYGKQCAHVAEIALKMSPTGSLAPASF